MPAQSTERRTRLGLRALVTLSLGLGALLTGPTPSLADGRAANMPPLAAASRAELDDAKALQARSKQLVQDGHYDDGLAAGERALQIRERLLGPTHLDVGESLNGVAVAYMFKGDFARAAPLLERAIAIREKARGPDHPDVAQSAANLAAVYQNLGEAARAEPLLLRALAIREKALGPDHPDVGLVHNNLGLVYVSMGSYGRAEPHLARGLAIREKALGPDHADVGQSCDNLGYLYTNMADFARAEPLLVRGLAIREKALGPEHPAVANSLGNLAALYEKKGEGSRAEPLRLRALAIWEKALGPEHPLVATALQNLATLYLDRAEHARAVPLYERALAIVEKRFGPEHPDVATVLDNLANLYGQLGDYARAEPLFQRALAIREKRLGPEHTQVAVTLRGLAVLFQAQRQHDRAVPLLVRALAIQEKALGPDHPDVAAPLQALGSEYIMTLDFAAAERAYLRALEIRETALGAQHPLVADTLEMLGGLYYLEGDLARAEASHARSLSILEKAFGPDNPSVATALSNLANLFEVKGDIPRAVEAHARAGAIQEHNLALSLASGSEAQKLAYMATLASQTNAVVSFHARAARADPAALRLAFTTVLRRKGRVLDSLTDGVAALRGRLAPPERAALDELAAVRAELAARTLAGPGRGDAAAHLAAVAKLDVRRDELEGTLSKASAEFRVQAEPVTIAKIQAAIPEGAALVELVFYRPFDPKTRPGVDPLGAARYVAYVLGRTGEPTSADLGEAAPIDDAVRTLRATLADARLPDPHEAARAVDERVMAKLRPLLGDARRVLISPDGSLNLVPFGALVDEQGRFLVALYSFTYVSTGRDLLRLAVTRAPRSPPLVVADPDFGRFVARGDDASPGSRRRSADFARASFPELPGTGAEGAAIAKLLAGSELLRGERATESALAHARAPSVLHVATHGFFLGDQKGGAESSRGLTLVEGDEAAGRPPAPRIENPLLRSGLALAGANEHRADGDGILTALEASGLDLWGTRLVVLSACETGVGDVQNGDGVYGLRRALVMAGAESEVMSLWKVDDEATRDLMIAYYAGLVRGGGRTEALREAQLGMMRTPLRAHPYYWASFVPSGDWRALSGAEVDVPRAAPVGAKVAPGACGCVAAGHSEPSGAGMAGVLAAALALAAAIRPGIRPRPRRRFSRFSSPPRASSRPALSPPRGALRPRARGASCAPARPG